MGEFPDLIFNFGKEGDVKQADHDKEGKTANNIFWSFGAGNEKFSYVDYRYWEILKS